MQLSEDTCHAPLPREGHLGVLTEGGTNNATFGQVGYLEVCQLLSSSLQVIYPMGLNGYEASVIASLPKSLARGTTLLGGEPMYQKVNILQPTPEGQEPKAPPHGSHFPHSSAKSSHGSSAKDKKRGQHDNGSEGTSITSSIRHIWTHVRELNPKRLNPVVMLTPLPPKLGDLSSQWTHHPR